MEYDDNKENLELVSDSERQPDEDAKNENVSMSCGEMTGRSM